MERNIDGICGNSSFWNADELVNSTYPYFSKCFQHTVLIWVPCGLLWLAAPFRIYHLMGKRNGESLPHNSLNVSKSVLSMMLCFLMVIDLVKLSLTWDPEPPVVFIGSAVKCMTFILTLVLLQLGRIKGLITSGVLFLFWLLTVVVGIIPFYTHIIQQYYQENLFRFTVFYIYWSVLLVQLILHCFADAPLQSKLDDKDRKPCPELRVSFLNKLSYWWVNSLVLTGFKKSLVEGDLWDLRPQDKGQRVIPQLEKVWKHDVANCKRHNDSLKENQPEHVTHNYTSKENGQSEYPTQNGFGYKFTDDGSAEMVPLNSCKDEEYVKVSDKKGRRNRTKDPSLLKVILKTFGKETLKGLSSRVFFDMMHFISPMLLGVLISYTQNKSTEPAWKGYCIAFSFFITALIQYTIFHYKANRMLVLGLRTKMALVAAVYKKSLIMNNETKKSSTVGEVVNLMAVDCGRVEDLNLFIMFAVSVPTRFTLCVILLWRTLGPSVLAGLALIVLLIPINTVISSNQRRLNRKLMEHKDARIKLMSEVLNGIKVLKLYAWEKSFQEKVVKIRNKELDVLRKLNYLSACRVFSFASAPFLVSLITFSIYVFTQEENYLDAQKAFVALALFNNLKFPLNMLPNIITYFIQARVSIGRISKFLRSGELDPDSVQNKDIPDIAVKVENGTFSWDNTLEPALQGINLEVPKGKLIAIVGQVGAGKSSLLSLFLGEMDKLQGRVNVTGSIAYVPQQAWIQNATLRDNVLFGNTLDHDKYTQVLEACALGPDLEILAGRDLTEIGEKGINLSGGQKQRVSLARAVYNNSDVYLMDDPLSAVDSHVGKHIFDKVMGEKGLLRNKTRVLVTHGVHWLPNVDFIVVLTDGQISEIGTYEELLGHDGAFAQFLKTYLLENKREEDSEIEHMREEILHRLDSVTSDSGDEYDHFRRRTMSNGKQRPTFNHIKDDLHQNGYLSAQTKPTYDRSTSAFDSSHTHYHKVTPKTIRKRQLNKHISNSHRTLNEMKAQLCGSVSSISRNKDNLIYTSMSSINQEIGEGDEEDGSKVEVEEEVKDDVLIQEEETEKGKVKANVFVKYFKAIGLGWMGVIFLVLVLQQVAGGAANILLSHWTEDPLLKNRTLANTTEYKSRNIMFVGVYAACGIGETLIELTFTLVLLIRGVTASQTLHTGMLINMLHVPMSFFDTTPLGRVLNRFSSDVQKIDQNLPGTFRMWFTQLFHTVAILIIISYNTPIFMTVIVPAAIFYFLVQRYYVPTSRQLQRLESKSRSPVYSHFGETITGSSTIRAFGQKDRFTLESQNRVDTNILFRYGLTVINRWSGIRLEVAGSLFVLAAALFAVITPNISGGIVGLSVAYALQITHSLNALVRTTSDLETNIVTVERVKEYSELKTEADWVIPSNRPPVKWPTSGDIVFQGYKTRYRPGLDLVLRGITCQVNGGEKVGIVGRTGAGKSSMMTALFRLIEAADGSILIDGQHIADIGLHDLRSKLTILPQDPVLFSGTLRMNLDPFNNYTDDQLWQAIEHAHLKRFVSELPNGLQHECGEGGQNLSVGQRQLVCLARTLLKKTKILILDEATAAVDMETDDLIQKTIRSEFKDCTVLTIAHRLNTIMDYDKVLVLGHGLIIEYNSPTSLLRDKNSVFYGMAKDSNLI